MGCCGSSEAVADETAIPPPEWGKPVSVTMRKKFMDADYDILLPGAGEDGKDIKWMLLDAVGSFWDDGYKYYLKHRAPGQVDEEGKPTSTVLGSVNIQGDWDFFSFKVNGGGADFDFGPVFDMWDGDIDWGMSQERSIWAVWTYSKRAVLYSDYEMTQQVGWLDITGSGTWHEWEEERVVWDTDDDGSRHKRIEYEHHQDCRTCMFQYELNVYNTPMKITYGKVHGGFWKASKLNFTAANAFAPQVPLFKVSGDGEYNCEVETFENSDPVSTLLAAYAISCKLDPQDFGRGAERMCERHVNIGTPPGFSNRIGMPFDEFVKTFSYPAPPKPVFAAQVASFVPPQQPMLVFGPGGMGGAQQPTVQPIMAPAQPMMAPAQPMAMAQPMMAPVQPMAMAQPMQAMPQPTVMTATASVPGGQPMQVQMADGSLITVQVPMGVQPGQQFQFQTAPPPQAMPQAVAVQPGYGANY